MKADVTLMLLTSSSFTHSKCLINIFEWIMNFKMYFSEIENRMKCFHQRVGFILDPVPCTDTFTLSELWFYLVPEEGTVSPFSYYWQMLYTLLRVPITMISTCLAYSSSLDSALMPSPERDHLWSVFGDFFQPLLTNCHPVPFLPISTFLKKSPLLCTFVWFPDSY